MAIAQPGDPLDHHATACRSCGAGIVFAVTPARKAMPVDRHPHPTLGTVELNEVGAELRATIHPHRQRPLGVVDLHQPHWVTCPHAADWRRK